MEDDVSNITTSTVSPAYSLPYSSIGINVGISVGL
jgi:hypothetical protein